MSKKLEQPNIQKSLAELLKERRTEKNLSIDELSQLTGISAQNIKYLEAGEYNFLPAAIYVEHFLVKCAETLGITKDSLLSAYRKEFLVNDIPKNLLLNQQPSFFRRKKVITSKFIIAAATFVIAIGIGAYLWYQLSHLLGTPFLIVENPKADIITNDEFIIISGRTMKDSHIFLNGREISNNSGYFEERMMLQQGMNTTEIKAVNRFERETIVMRRIIKN